MKFLLALLTALSAVSATLFEQVYIQLEPESVTCFRLLNGTHQFGCQSDRKGDVGLVVRISSQNDEQIIEDCWKSRYPEWDGGFAVLIDSRHFHNMGSRIVDKLRTTKCISIVLLYETRLTPFLEAVAKSDDALCSNEHSNIYNDCPSWNERGALIKDGLMFTDWPKPVMTLTNETNIEMVSHCADILNKANGSAGDWPIFFPLCAISVKVFSYAAGSTDLCMRRNQGTLFELDNPVSFCDPLQDWNVFVAMPPKVAAKQSTEERTAKYFSITTRMDSLSMVPENSAGDISALTSIMTVLVAARALSKERADVEKAANATNRHLLFSFFHGEAFDYIGSSRTFYDMDKKDFPSSFNDKLTAQKEIITPDQVEGLLEVQQIGTDHSQFFVHVDHAEYDKDKQLTDQLLDAARSASTSATYSINFAKAKQLPPSSLYSFYRNRRRGFRTGMLLTQFDEKYKYSRVNSMLDENEYSLADQLSIKAAIKKAATIVVSMAHSYLDMSTEKVVMNETYIDELFDCFLTSQDWWSCSLFDAVLEPFLSFKSMKKKELAKTTYIGADGRSLIRNLVAGLAVEATGLSDKAINVADEQQCEDMNQHQTLYRYVWQRNRNTSTWNCIQSTMFLTKALSPAFAEDGTNFTGTKFSTWTEASYSLSDNSKGVLGGPKIFLVEPYRNESTIVVVAVSVFFISCLIFGRFGRREFVISEGEPMAEAGEPL